MPEDMCVPFTSGQLSAWLLFYGPSSDRLTRWERWTFPEEVSRETVVEAVRQVTGCHEALRTTARVGADGLMEQRIHPVGPVDMEHLDQVFAEDEIIELIRRLVKEPIAMAEGPLPRWIMGRTDTGGLFLLLLLHHFVLGSRGGKALRDELMQIVNNLSRGLPAASGLPEAMNPRDFLAEESGGRGERTRERARRFTRPLLRDMSSTPFPMDLCEDALPSESAGEISGPGRRMLGELHSTRLRWRLEKLSEEWRIPVSAIVLGGLCLVLQRVVPDKDAMVWQVFSDAAGTGAKSCVGYQPMISVLRVNAPDEGDLYSAARGAWKAMLGSLRAQAPGETVPVEESFRVSRERGVKLVTPFLYNYVAHGGGVLWEQEDGARPGDASSKPDKIEVSYFDNFPGIFFTCYVRRLPGVLQISLYLHERMLGENSPHDLLRSLADLLHGPGTSGAVQSDPLAVLRRVEPQEDWLRLSGGRWVKPSAVGEALASLHGIVEASTEIIEDGDGGKRLLARVRTTDASSDPGSLRERCHGLLDTAGFVVPDLIDVTGSDLPPDGPPPSSAALDALRTVVTRALPSEAWDAQRCYLASGGELAAVPGVLEGLKKSGWEGLSWKDICSHRPFSELAAAMRRI
ncbi:condensation domain-containing protein [Streptomyces anulatus]